MQEKLKNRIDDMRKINKIQKAPDTLEIMRKAVGAKLKEMKEILENPQTKLPGLNLEVRMYIDLPIIHGFSTNQPQKTHYLAFPRWHGPTYKHYDWGDGKYHVIFSSSPQSPDGDLTVVFDSYFEHLWNKSGEPVYKYPGNPLFEQVARMELA